MSTNATNRFEILKDALLAVAAIFLGPYYIAKEWWTWLREASKYYRNQSFRHCDRELSRKWGVRPPSWVVLDSTRARQPYGETPLETYEWLTLNIPNAHNLRWIEPGCGRGRGIFWLATHLKPEQKIEHQVTGVDLSTQFFQSCRAIQIKLGMDSCRFILSDFCEIDYRPYDVVFLYATCTGDQDLVELSLRLLRLKPGSWVASITFPIEAYAIEGTFEPSTKRPVQMIWGETTLHISQRTSHMPVGGSAVY